MSSRPPAVTPECRPASIAETLGGADVAHVFVHDLTWFARREGYHFGNTRTSGWAERALVVARPHDVVCLLEPVDEAFLAHLSALGIGPRPEHVVTVAQGSDSDPGIPLAERLAHDDRALRAIGALVAGVQHVVLDPFIPTDADFRLAEALGRALDRRVRVLGAPPDVILRVNRKDHVRTKAAELGVPLAPGDLVELPAGPDGRPADLSPLASALTRRAAATGRALVRGAWGAAGSATFIVAAGREQDVLRDIGDRTGNRVYLVDTMQDVRVSPNVLLYVEPPGGAVSWVGASDQRLDATLVHRGNLYPSRAGTLSGMVESACRLARWLQKEGVVGLVGFDFCEYRNPDTGRDEHFLAEVNARVNGAAYPMFLLDGINGARARDGRPPVPAFLSVQTLPTQARSFPELVARHRSSLFDHTTARGFVPFTTKHLAGGVCSGAFLGATVAEVLEMHEAWLAAAEGSADRAHSALLGRPAGRGGSSQC